MTASEPVPVDTPFTFERDVSTGGYTVWPVYYLLFFVSGFPALLYQIVWERALFTLYGVNIESVTIIVTVFMLGLGLGSLAGGKLSTRPGVQLLRAFGAIELSIGAFGAVSLWIFHHIASFTAGASTAATGVITFALLLIPTLLMGSTLPLLVAHFVRHTRKVGESVAALYSANTLGSALACFAAALFIMRTLGESGSVRLAALLNTAVGLTALVLYSRTGLATDALAQPKTDSNSRTYKTLPFGIAMLLAGTVGFISLAYEIIWYRLYSFTSGSAAPCFAKLLAFYLAGIAYGSFAVRDICRRKLRNDLRRTLEAGASVIILGSVAGFLVGPALSFSVRFVPYDTSFTFVFIGAALLGAAFPILAQAALDPNHEAGSRISYLYLSNIIGSALGSFLIGFVAMDHWSIQTTSSVLLGLGAAAAIALAPLAKPIRFRGALAAGLTAGAVLMLGSHVLYANLYERLLMKQDYTSSVTFKDLVENRSGVIAVTPNGTVFGGGVYDGAFNTDPVNDTNNIFRAYAIAGLHPEPKQVLVIGLSSGSWAQVVANHPEVQKVTIVEINPGYLPLIRQHPVVSGLLKNPKIEIAIDDGRRWLLSHPDRRFDFILMNTSFHWRANASNLLSTEFLKLLRSHLNPRGIAYYNTTWSGEVQATGSAEFPYALRIANFLAVSESPIKPDRQLWRTLLVNYKIDGRPVFDMASAKDQSRLDEILKIVDEPQGPPKSQQMMGIETRSELIARWKGYRLITDDNMGTEWR